MGFVDLPIATWLMLNSPMPPRRFMKMGMGVLAGIHKLASALMLLPNPLDCMKTAAFWPTAYDPTAMPMASSSLVHETR